MVKITCIWIKNSVLILRALSLSLSERDEQRESTSSINMMAGVFSRAISNKFFTSFSDSPNHLLTKSADETEKKVESASVATAFAKYDFPVPGGPKRRIPLHGLRFPVNK